MDFEKRETRTMSHRTTTRFVTRILPMLLLGGLAFQACDDDVDSPAGHAGVGSSWTQFQSGNWQAASDGFLSALSGDPFHPEALCGLAWSQAMLNDGSPGGPDYRDAIEDNFLLADQLRPGYQDAWAGLASFYSSQSDTLLAIEWSLDLLNAAGESYVFTHRPEVNSRAMHKIAAWNLFKLSRYAECESQVRSVFPDFNPDDTDPLYLETLLARINDL